MGKYWFFALGLLAASAAAQAQDYSAHSFTLAPEAEYYKYTEEAGGKELMHIDGPLYGLSGSYSHRGLFSGNGAWSVLGLEGRYLRGDLDYNGQLMDGTPIKISGESHYYAEARATAGIGFTLANDAIFTPYLGFGARYLVDNGQRVSAASYRRTSTYLYLPMGAKLDFQLADGFIIGLIGEFDWFLKGRQTSRFTDITPLADTLVQEQTDGYGLRGSVKVSKDMGGALSVFVEPYVRWWEIKDSEPSRLPSGPLAGWYVEPHNKTVEAGLRLGVEF
ncbi:hypothetical protein FACS1894186_8000 [Alphaproteobacteria bacterium]|nr:hypothetical protein FACS1894186_8000 [Alphaproteobacteria bacterium]